MPESLHGKYKPIGHRREFFIYPPSSPKGLAAAVVITNLHYLYAYISCRIHLYFLVCDMLVCLLAHG
ncbi:MAG: hypothetical protein DRN15_08960 [Thermoprotei archaeon]|nr:MAG: hypothetical protein DRN15_08960 [Thermoprotei archaeon]